VPPFHTGALFYGVYSRACANLRSRRDGDIAEVALDARPDAIVYAANARGWMGGRLGKQIRLRGTAESLHYAMQGRVEALVKREFRETKVGLGEVVVTPFAPPLPGNCLLLHALTMMRPGQRTELATVERCLASLRQVIEAQGFVTWSSRCWVRVPDDCRMRRGTPLCPSGRRRFRLGPVCGSSLDRCKKPPGVRTLRQLR